ncbi:MAG TPA: hypothetical protein VEI46_03410 [Thermodesulfovibrionales bacterium]|nr:hypothetical protein [Thermodesulfovibrionales bacterium]
MEAYRYQQIAYLIVPVLLGIEFFISAKDEEKQREDTPLGSYVLDFLGFLFMALIPAIFIFTIWTVETKAFPFRGPTLARLDRYAVLFLFMGSWWQVHMIAALRARRMAQRDGTFWYLWGPYLVLGIFVSMLILWVSPFHMKWVSMLWFLLVFGMLRISKAKPKTIERLLWIFAAILFIIENILFMFLETVV